jgi:hypothetical protein
MNDRYFMRAVLASMLSVFCPILASATVYKVGVHADQLEFVPQPEKGYVVKLAEKAGGIHALAEISAPDATDAREVHGPDRHGVWTVENAGPASRNENTIRSLWADGRVAYAAPLFSSNGETIAIIPEIVIRMKPGTEMEQLKALCEKAKCQIKKRMEFTQQEYLLEVLGPDADDVFAAVDQLGQTPEVEWACPNTAFRPKLSGQAMQAIPAPGGQPQIASVADDPNTPGVFRTTRISPSNGTFTTPASPGAHRVRIFALRRHGRSPRAIRILQWPWSIRVWTSATLI